MALLDRLFAPVALAINQAIAQTPAASAMLTRLMGRCLAVHFNPPGFSLYIRFTPVGLRLMLRPDGSVDAALSGSPITFARMQFSENSAQTLFSGEVETHGDIALVRRVQRLFEVLHPDWPAILQRGLGLELAERIWEQAQGTRHWADSTCRSLQEDMTDYLQTETRTLPGYTEAQLFYADVDELRDDCERLGARLERLGHRGVSA